MYPWFGLIMFTNTFFSAHPKVIVSIFGQILLKSDPCFVLNLCKKKKNHCLNPIIIFSRMLWETLIMLFLGLWRSFDDHRQHGQFFVYMLNFVLNINKKYLYIKKKIKHHKDVNFCNILIELYWCKKSHNFLLYSLTWLNKYSL